MLAFVGDYFVEDAEAGWIAESFELLAVLGDVSAFVDLEAAESEVGTAEAVGERGRLPGGIAGVLRLGSAERRNAPSPEFSMVLLGGGEAAESVAAMSVGLLGSESGVGMKALHLGLPVGFKRSQEPSLVCGSHDVSWMLSGGGPRLCLQVLSKPDEADGELDQDGGEIRTEKEAYPRMRPRTCASGQKLTLTENCISRAGS